MHTTGLKVLVSGTGIAGAAAALFLSRDGHDLTLVDKAPAFRRLGYGLSLKSFGLSVMKDLGLARALEQRAIPIRMIQLRDADGTLINEYSADVSARAASGAIGVYRSDLHDVLYSAIEKTLPVRFGTTIAGLEEADGAAHVTFSDGTTDRFDVVVVAEGLHSTTRALLWNDDGLDPVDIVYVGASVEHGSLSDPGVVEVYMGPGTNFVITPVSEGAALIQGFFRGTLQRGESLDEVKERLFDSFRSFDPRILDLIHRISTGTYLFYDRVTMVRLPILSRQRTVLVGDAGYCPTFLSGMGASLGLLGAKAISQALRSAPSDLELAFTRYNELMQPLVRLFQDSASRHVESLLALSPTRLWLRDWSLRLLPRAAAEHSWGRQFDTEGTLVHRIMEADV
jgi:2-polyprenyl-6-methoxyphenol hydroxylase-like FAD-dependent oxidoreductase